MNNEPEPIHERPDASSLVPAAVARHQAPLLRYATRLLGGDADRARDVVQDTFVRLMAQPPAQVDGHVAEWLFTVCRNRTHDVLRKEGRMKRFEEGQVERLTAPDPRPGRSRQPPAGQRGAVPGVPGNHRQFMILWLFPPVA